MRILHVPTIVTMSLCYVGVAAETHKPETPGSFQVFLEHSLERQHAGMADVEAFYARAWTFWIDHLEDFEQHPDHYQSILSLYYKDQDHYRNNSGRNIDRFGPEVDKFKELDAHNTVPAKPILFVGSSSIVQWKTALAFPSYPVVNRGFGGSTLADLNHFYDDVVKKYKPSVIVMYCDNDIYRGDSPQVALQRFKEFVSRVAHDLPETELLYLSIKPTPADAFYGQHVRENAEVANSLFKAFIATQKNVRYVDVARAMVEDGKLRTDIFIDGMHLNERGYAIWNPIVGKQLAAVYHPSLGSGARGRQRAQ
jgi:lysophospholipase L1-like esterase